MSRIVFWNVNRKDLTGFVCTLAKATRAEVLVLNENIVSIEQTLMALRKDVDTGFFIPNSGSEKRFHCFCRNPKLDLSEVHSGFRTSVRNLKIGSTRNLLVLVHGVDIRNYDSEARQAFAQSLAEEILFVKKEHETNKLVLLGDFNMNPYDRGMNLAPCLNAMMTKACVTKGSRKHLHKNYEYYYNPMWSLFGDNSDGPAGTVYDTSNQGPYGWSILDQVVVSHSIVDLFDNVKILTSAGDHSLLDTAARPDKKHASDHFPILVNLGGNTND